MKDSLVIGLVGQKGGGKGTVAQMFVDRYQAAHYKFSDPLSDTLKRFYIPVIRQHQIDLVMFFRDRFGEDILGRVLMKDVEQDARAIIVLDGIRMWDEVHLLRELPSFLLLHVFADVKKRFERTLKRGEKADDAGHTFESFVKEHEQPTERTIDEIARHARFSINNNGTVKELEEQVNQLFKKLSDEYLSPSIAHHGGIT